MIWIKTPISKIDSTHILGRDEECVNVNCRWIGHGIIIKEN